MPRQNPTSDGEKTVPLCYTKISEDVRKYTPEHDMSDQESLKAGTDQKSKEFVEKGAEVYTPA